MANWAVSTANLPVFLNGTPSTQVRTDGTNWQVYTVQAFPLPGGSVEEYLSEVKGNTEGLFDTDLEFFSANEYYAAEATVSGWRAATPEELAVLNAE